MNKFSTSRAFLLGAAALLATIGAEAATFTKADNITAFATSGSWTTAGSPGSGDIADWSGTYNTAGSLSVALPGSTLSWGGISIGSISGTAAGLVSIGGTAAATASSALTIGSSGINMSSANQNLVINAATINLNTSQTFNIASGRNLRFGTSGTGAGNAKVVGSSASAVITIAGSGVFDANQGGSTGYTDAAGYTGYLGKWAVNSGATLRGSRNGSTAWGANTSADAILLNGGTLAVGGISSTQGNWTWNTKMTLADGTASTIDNQIFSGTDRWLKLEGAIAGGALNTGTLTIKNTNTSVMNNDEYGFILAGASTFTGALTIGASTYVRIGGSAAGTATRDVGNNGSLSAASIANSGVIRFTRNDTWTLASDISGAGLIKVGSSVAGAAIGSTASQVVTLSGALSGGGNLFAYNGEVIITGNNTRSGGNELQGGNLTVSSLNGAGGVGSAGTGYVAIKSGSTLKYTGGTVSTTRNLFLDNGAATINITDANAVVTWSDSSTKGGASGGLITKAGAGTLVLSGVIASGGSTAVSVTGGTLRLSGANTYTGGTTITAGTLQVGNAGASGALGTGAVSVSSGAYLKFNRTGLLTVSANIDGAGDITNDGTGEISLTGTNTFTGNLTVNAGTLAFEGVNSGGSLASVAIASTGRVAVGSGFAGGTLTLKNLSGSGLINSNFNATAGTRTLSIDSAADTTFSGTINDDTAATGRILAIEKKGASTLTLSGSGNFTGGTRLTNGTLNVTGNTALGTGALTIAGGTLSGSATLANAVVLNANLAASIATSSTLTVGAVSESGGSFGLTKTGNGTLSLTGSNSYTGATTVSAGRLKISTGASLASSSIVLADGATLETVDGLSLGSGKALSLGAGSAIASATHVGGFTLSGGALNIDFGASTNDLLAVTGDLGLTSGTINFTKASAYVSGSYTLATYTGTLSGAASNISTTGLSADGTSRQTFTLATDATSKLLQLVVGGQAQNVLWTGATDGSWGAGGSSSANWQVTDLGYSGTQGSQFFNGDTATFDDTAVSGSVALGTSLSPVAAIFSGNTLEYSLTSSGGSIAAGSLTKSGNATLTIGMANSYAGGTALSAGRLRLGADGALGSGLVTISGGRLSSVGTAARAVANNLRFTADVSLGDTTDNGVLTLSGGIDLNAGAPRTLTLDSDVVVSGAISNGSLTKSGNGKLTLSGANSLGVGLTVGAGTVALGAAGVISDSAAVSVLSGATLDLAGYTEALGSLSLASGSTVTAGNISGGVVTINDNVTFGATLTSASQLVKNGSFSLTLGSASARTGSTTLNAGSILVGDVAALGTGGLTLNGGTLAMSDATDRTLANNLTVGGDVTLGAASTGKLTFSGTVGLGAQNRTLTTGNDVRLNGVVSNGSLTKAGNGVLTLTASNTYTLGTTITSGSVVITAANALGTAGTVTLNSASTGSSNTSLGLDVSGANLTLARAITVANEGTGTTTIGSTSFGGSTLQAIFSGGITLAKDVTLTAAAGGDRTQFSGGITGTGNVTIGGTGRVLFLTTANTFTGNITLAANSVLQLSDGTSTANSLIPDAAVVTLNSGSTLRIGKGGNATAETIGGLAGSGTVTSVAGADKLIIDQSSNSEFSGSFTQTSGSIALTKSGSGALTLSGSYGLTGALTVNAGRLVFTKAATLAGDTTVKGTLVLQGDTLLGNNLVNTTSDTAAEVDFGANTLTIGTGSSGTAYYGKLTGTGTIVLAGGTGSVANVTDGTTAGNNTGNRQVWVQTASGVVQSTDKQLFGLNTGASLSNRRDFIYANDLGEALNLSSLSGYGSIRGDWGTPASVRQFIVDQSTDTVFNGAILSHRSGTGTQRGVSLTKRGSGTLELAGFVGKQTASSQAGTGGGVALTVEAGVLNVTNANNTTTTNTDAINLGVVTVTGGTLGFSAQALLNTAGTAGATRVDMNGGTLRWNTGNTQDLTAGGRLNLVDGKVARLDTNGNDVTLGTAFALGAAKTAGLTKLGNGTLTLTAANAFTGDVTVSGGALVLNAANAFAGAVTVSGGSLTLGNVGALGAAAATVSGGTLNLGGYAATNAITYSSGTLSGASAYAGALTIAGGRLTFADLTTFGTGSITVGAGATLDLNFLNPTNAITLNGGSLLNFSGWNGGVSLTGTVDATLINSLAANEVTVKAGATVDLTGVTKDIVYQGGTLSNLSTYEGTLVVRGALDFTSASPAAAATIRVADGGSVNVAGFAGSVEYAGGAISNYTGAVTVVGTGVALTAGNLADARLVVGSGASVTIGSGFSNAIRMDGGAITGDTLNNFSGTVTVAAGKTLDIDGPDSLAVITSAASVVVEDGATLKGSGSLGQVTVQAGGILAPGNSPGLLTFSSLSLAVDPVDGSAGSMTMEIASILGAGGVPPVAGTDHDSVAVSGLLDLSQLSRTSRFMINLVTLSEDGVTPGAARGWDPAVDFELVLFTYGNLDLGANTDINRIFSINTVGFLDSLGQQVAANHFHVIDDVLTQQVRLTYSSVPEPSTYGAILGGLALAAAAIRRRRKQASK